MDHPRQIREISSEVVTLVIDGYLRAREDQLQRGVAPSKCVLILRGMPGSGKTMFARCVELYATSLGLQVSRLSTDDGFITDQGYVWRARRLGGLHERCYARFLDAVRGIPDVIIVNNTNLDRTEYWRYLQEARQAQITRIVSFVCTNLAEATWQASRCPNAIPVQSVVDRFDVYDLANWTEDVNNEVSFWIEPRSVSAPLIIFPSTPTTD